MKQMILLVSLIALAACSTAADLATCKGPTFALNTGRWQPTPADLALPKAGKTE